MRPTPVLQAAAAVAVLALLISLVTSGDRPAAAREQLGDPWASGGALYAPGSGRSMPAAARGGTFTFDPSVAPVDRQVVEAAVAASRPEAQALVAMVDGLTVVRVRAPASGALGTTRPTDAGFEVELDLGTASRHLGQRGINRLVLHELAHVIDGALLTDGIRATLDAGVPEGWGCDQGVSGACAPREERFAESFAKWATGDIGVNLPSGYKVPPPAAPLDEWGEPLARLATGA